MNRRLHGIFPPWVRARDPSAKASSRLTVHRHRAIAVSSIRSGNQWGPGKHSQGTSLILLFPIMLGVMSVGADYRARMVYNYNTGGNARSQPIDFTK